MCQEEGGVLEVVLPGILANDLRGERKGLSGELREYDKLYKLTIKWNSSITIFQRFF